MYTYLQNAVKALLMVLLAFSRGGMHTLIAGNVQVAAANIHMRIYSHQSVN